MEETDQIQQKLPHQEFDYFKIGKIVFSRWYWIVFAVIVCYAIADVYLWYTPKSYRTESTLKMEEQKPEMSQVLSEIGTEDKSQPNIEAELYVLQSRSLIINAIKDLDYPVSFYLQGRVKSRTKELYPSKPLNIKILNLDTNNYYTGLIACTPIDEKSFNLAFRFNGHDVKEAYNYNQPVSIGSTTFTIAPVDVNKPTYTFRFNTPKDLFGRVRGGLSTSEDSKSSGIINLGEQDSNPQFAADILNAIMAEYLLYEHYQKQLSASQVISFVDKQLDTMSKKVGNSSNAIESYKQNSKLLDVNSAAQTQLTKVTQVEGEKAIATLQLKTTEDFKQSIVKEQGDIKLGLELEGVNSRQLEGMVSNYNQLINDRTGLLKTYINTSPPVKQLERQIANLRNSILTSIDQSEAVIKKKIAIADEELKAANARLATFPAAERQLASLTRDFEISQKVYSLLSERKINAQISRSAIAPGASIVERAEPNFSPVSPDERNIRRSAILLGLALGMGSIVLIRVLNPYIYDKETIESLTTIPIIGIIRKYPQKMSEDITDILVLSQPKSVFSESVRSVRTNLNFLAAEKNNKVICITSEVAGEGKSFVAVNLSSTLALIDKKVILIAADLRRSKLHKTFHVSNNIGLSNYLSHQTTAEEIIIRTNQANFDFYPS